MDSLRRKVILGGGALIAAGALGAMHQVAGQNKAPTKQLSENANARLGINFSGIAHWSTELPFANIMQQSSEWVSQPPNGDWGKGPALILDEQGWVKQLEKGCRATKILATTSSTYPKGVYTVIYEGEGEIALTAPIGRIKKHGAGKLTIDVNNDGMLAIDIVSTNPDNHLRNIRVVMPGLETSHSTNPWNPAFLARWSGVACIRVMDMMATNHSKQKNWVDRPQVNDASYAHKGVPVELLVDLANRLATDIWFCMPHMADDDYIKQFATLVSEQLNPTLRAWVEYSNEVWNGGFSQFSYAANQGKALQLSQQDWEAAFQYNAKRSVEIFKIWTATFANPENIVRVIASQAANARLSEQLLTMPEVAKEVDVLAIAPYLSLNVSEQEDDQGLSATKVASWSLDQLFTHIKNVRLPESERWTTANKKIADAYGLKLVAYEAGQHLVGIQGGENNEQLTKLFIQANADKRMGDVYRQHLNDWTSSGGDLWCAFNSMSDWSKWGSWGLLASADKPTAKYRVTIEWAQSRGQNMSVMQ
jgi:hypothetical protein